MRWQPSVAALVVMMLLAPAVAVAQPAFYGYVKQLGLYSRSFLDEEPYRLSMTRLRFQSSYARGDWTLEAWTDAQLTAGTLASSSQAGLAQAVSTEPLVDLTATHVFSDDAQGTLRIYRATLSQYAERYTLIIGRQRVAWGTGFIWNPTDLLNPLPPASLERDEQTAVDAVRVRVPLGALSGLDIVAAPARDRDDGRYGLRMQGHRGEFDLGMMGGWFASTWVTGADFAGYLGNAGVRGEISFALEETVRLRAVLNVDYTLASGWYVMLEGYVNGFGATSKSQYDWLGAASAQGLARTYGALVASRSLHPLLVFNAYWIQNMTDGSGLAGPGLAWSVRENLEAALTCYGFYGRSGRLPIPGSREPVVWPTEYGLFDPMVFASLQWFF